MKLSLASAHAVAAALLLAHACTPQHSTAVDASMPRWLTNFKTWIVSSMPKSKRAHDGAHDGTPKVPSAKIKLEKLIAAPQDEVKAVNDPKFPGLLQYFYPILGAHRAHIIQKPFDQVTVDYKDVNKEHVYAKYKNRVAQTQDVTLAQTSIYLPLFLVRHPSEFGIEEGYYTYETYKGFQPSPDIVNFWVNFACKNVFGHYDSGFVQDEIQNLEIPAEAAIAEQFRKSKGTLGGIHQSLIHNDGTPSPIVVTNMIQYMLFDSFKSKIYGSTFPSASTQAIDTAAQILQTPRTGIHVLALLAPQRNGNDKGKPYTALQIKATLYMALTGFILARLESYGVSSQWNVNAIPVVNSGNWGAGLFGNNLLMMALIQMAAACAAGVHFVAWVGNERIVWEQALAIFLKEIWPVDQLVVTTHELVRRIQKLGIKWM